MATERDKDFPELLQIDFPGGCPMVVDPHHPHLGGNMRGGDVGTDYTSDLWPWLVRKYSPKTVLDVGCAEGHALRAFRNLGCQAIGVEGLWQNARRCGLPVLVHDLTTGPVRFEGIDLIWCCDVAEHVEEKHLGNLLAALSGSPTLAFVHGTQEHRDSGWHHVNNQPSDYWIRQLESVGMRLDEAATKEANEVAPRGWWNVSGKIFRKAT